jgi:hypothetical protein
MSNDSPRTPTRRSQRVQSHLEQSPTRDLHAKKQSPAEGINVFTSIFLAFLARRHLHIYVLRASVVLMLSSLVALIVLKTQTMVSILLCSEFLLSTIGVLWYFFGRPSVYASARSMRQIYYASEGPSGQGEKHHWLASCYIASTGYTDEFGNDLLGLYASEFIPAG